MSDRLALANAIEDAGIERAKAERVASVIIDAIHDNVATKADIEAVRTTIAEVKHDLTMRGIAGLIAASGILFAALHMWPPHG
jgi:hypothetical protein